MNGTPHTPQAWSDDEARRRDKLLASLLLPKSITVGDRSVSAAACRAVLYRIAAHAGPDACCYPSVVTLARETGQGRRTVCRAIEALARLQIIQRALRRSDGSRIVCNHYWIDWGQIEARSTASRHPETAPSDVPPGARYATVAHCCETERCATSAPPMCHQRATDVPPGPTTSGVNGDVFKPPAPSGGAISVDGAGVLKIRKIRWGRRVEAAELLDPPRLLPDLLATAILHGVCRDTPADRLAFASLLAYALRQRSSTNRFGLFSALLTGRHCDRFGGGRDWRGRPTNADEQQGRQWLAAIDRADRDAGPLAAASEAAAADHAERQAATQQRDAHIRRFAAAVRAGEFRR